MPVALIRLPVTEAVAVVQKEGNANSMKGVIDFIAIATGPKRDTAEIPRNDGPVRRIDATNARILASGVGGKTWKPIMS